jgi:hypothetical protein
MAKKIVLALILFGLALTPAAMSAEDVVLVPGYISGTATVTGESITALSVGATWTAPDGTNYSASTYVSNGSTYTLTVNVPQGSTPTYTVYATAYLASGGYLSFPSQTVGVTASNTSVADFSLTPGYIAASVTSTVAGSLSYAYFYAGGASVYAPAGSGTLTVAPGSNYVYGYAYFTDGTYAFLDYQYPTVTAGDTTTVSWTVTPPPPAAKGNITGSVHVNGATPDSTYVTASGPSYVSGYAAGDGSFSFADVVAGGYYFSTYSYFGNSYLYHPDSAYSPARSVTVSSGATSNVDITVNTASMSGKLTLTGSASLSQANSASLSANGASGTNASGASAGTSPNPQTGAYSLTLTDGGWSPTSLYLNFYDAAPATFLNESLNFFDYRSYYNPVTLAAGDAVTKNLTYGTGAVTVNFSVLGGATLSSPYLDGNCYAYEAGNVVRYYSFYAYGNASNATDAAVKFVGMGATCTVNAWALVGGSYTKFGTLTLDVVPGTDVVVDIGGPSLTVNSPEAASITDQASIVVTGTATDDVAVDSVTVNGVVATLTPGASMPQVSFSSPVSLDLGPNQIVTVATDSSGKSSSDTRTVYRDGAAPTLNWSPDDQSTTNASIVNVTGTADDDAGIATVTVNGTIVFQSAAPGSGPTHVDFNVPHTLHLGDNFIEVVATDISTRVTPQTHKVTYTEQPADTTAPVITAADVTVPSTGALTSVPFAASALDDVDGAVAVSCSLPSPALLPVGSTVVTCTAIDAAGNDAEASFTITVTQTNSAPTCAATPSVATLWPANHTLVEIGINGVTDADGDPVTVSVTSILQDESTDSQGDGHTASDAAGIGTARPQVRAERAGNGNGRVYRLLFSATDSFGGSCSGEVKVSVPHDQGRNGVAIDDGPTFNSVTGANLTP